MNNNSLNLFGISMEVKNTRQNKQNKDNFRTQSIFDSFWFTFKYFYIFLSYCDIDSNKIIESIVYILIEQENKAHTYDNLVLPLALFYNDAACPVQTVSHMFFLVLFYLIKHYI